MSRAIFWRAQKTIPPDWPNAVDLENIIAKNAGRLNLELLAQTARTVTVACQKKLEKLGILPSIS